MRHLAFEKLHCSKVAGVYSYETPLESGKIARPHNERGLTFQQLSSATVHKASNIIGTFIHSRVAREHHGLPQALGASNKETLVR
jgi:hypothetical protein